MVFRSSASLIASTPTATAPATFSTSSPVCRPRHAFPYNAARRIVTDSASGVTNCTDAECGYVLDVLPKNAACTSTWLVPDNKKESAMAYSPHEAHRSTGTNDVPDNHADRYLADWLNECVSVGHRVAYLHGDYLCKVVDLDEPGGALYPADPEAKAKAILKRLVGRRLLLRLELPLQTLQHASAVDPEWAYSMVEEKGEVDTLVFTRDRIKQFLQRISSCKSTE